jgi:signal transduction histidine kinase
MKSSAEDLNKTINNLNKRISELEKQLKVKSDGVLKQGLQFEFLSQITHELRTPVNILLNAVDMLRENYLPDPDDYAKEILSILNNAGKRIHRTTDVFVHLLELQTGNYNSAISHIDLYEDIKTALFSQFNEQAKEKDIGFYWKEIGKKHTVETDAYAITEIFIQLIDNAVKFTNFGKVEINVINKNNKHSITVEDTGVGINEEFIPNLFKPFLQEDSGYARRFEGSGLGLTIAKQFADMIHATIEVESEKGVGSKFTITLRKD